MNVRGGPLFGPRVRIAFLLVVLILVWGHSAEATTLVYVFGDSWAVALGDQLGYAASVDSEAGKTQGTAASSTWGGYNKVLAFGPNALVAVSGVGRVCGADGKGITVTHLLQYFGWEESAQGVTFDNCSDLGHQTFRAKKSAVDNARFFLDELVKCSVLCPNAKNARQKSVEFTIIEMTNSIKVKHFSRRMRDDGTSVKKHVRKHTPPRVTEVELKDVRSANKGLVIVSEGDDGYIYRMTRGVDEIIREGKKSWPTYTYADSLDTFLEQVQQVPGTVAVEFYQSLIPSLLRPGKNTDDHGAVLACQLVQIQLHLGRLRGSQTDEDHELEPLPENVHLDGIRGRILTLEQGRGKVKQVTLDDFRSPCSIRNLDIRTKLVHDPAAGQASGSGVSSP